MRTDSSLLLFTARRKMLRHQPNSMKRSFKLLTAFFQSAELRTLHALKSEIELGGNFDTKRRPAVNILALKLPISV